MALKGGAKVAIWAKLFDQTGGVAFTQSSEWVFVQDEQKHVFEVHSSDPSFHQYLKTNDFCWVYVAQVLKEDSEKFYGFTSPTERQFFFDLSDLNGVGPKTAAMLANGIGVKNVQSFMNAKSLKAYKIKGVGPKSLEKVSSAMNSAKKKFEKYFGVMSIDSGAVQEDHMEMLADIESALSKLGLRSSEISKVLSQLEKDGVDVKGTPLDMLLPLVLKKWGQMKTKNTREGRA